jgi:serine/threonine protein kinase
MQVSVTSGSCIPSGLSPDPADQAVSALELDDRPLYSGGQGTIYKVVRIDGRSRSNLLAKHFNSGLQSNLVEMIAALRSDPNRVRAATALKALPILLFKGASPAGKFEGYLMRRIAGRSLEKMEDPSDAENVRARGRKDYERFLGLDVKDRLQMCLQFVKAMEVFYQLGIIHCDLKPDNVLIDMDNCDLSIIDFDGGVHAPNRSVPVAFSEDRWTDPLYFEELLRTGNPVVQATVDSERWSVACGVCHVLAGREPTWFIGGMPEVPAYQRKYSWPECQGLLEFPLSPGGQKYAKRFVAALSQAPNTLKYLRRTFHEGYSDRHRRPTPTQFRIQLEQDLGGFVSAPRPARVQNIVLDLHVSSVRVHAGDSVELTWTSQNCTSLTLNGTTVPLSGRRSTVISAKADFVLAGVDASGRREERRVTVDVVMPAPKPVSTVQVRRFQVNSTNPKAGDTVFVSWEVLNAHDVFVEFLNGSGQVLKRDPVQSTGSTALANIRTTTVVVIKAVDSSGNTTAQQLTVSVRPAPLRVRRFVVAAVILLAVCFLWLFWRGRSKPPIIGFSADRSVISRGETVNLRWSASNATRVSIDPGLGDVPAQGDRPISPQATTQYTLTADGPGGRLTSQFTVQVTGSGKKKKTIETPIPTPAPAITSFDADRRSIERGSSTFLRWSVAGSTAVRIEPGLGAFSAQGEKTISPGQTTRYTLVAEGPGGNVEGQVTVRVEAPQRVIVDSPPPPPPLVAAVPTIAAFEAVPSPVEQCAIAILRWTVKGASNVAIGPEIGSVDPSSGYKVVRAIQTTRYTLRAVGTGGSVSRDVTLSVAHATRASCGQ